MAILNPDSLPYKILVTSHTGSIVTTTMSHQEMLHQEEMTSDLWLPGYAVHQFDVQFGITTAI